VKISINTFHLEEHAGAVLQAYALSRTLQGMGHDPELLAYARSVRGGDGRTLKQRIMRIATRKSETSRQYAAFRARFLRESERLYHSHEEVAAHPPQADAYLCGSDQIWNPELLAGNRFDPAYFLQYGPPDVPRISYAASFGGFMPGPGEEALLRTYLSSFSAISVREPAARERLSKILGREVALTLDPTLLLDDYTELLQPIPEAGPYVLLYALQNSPEIRQSAKDVADHFGLPIWSAGGPLVTWRVLGRRIEVHSPSQWVNLIHGAAAVVTNSFHGVAFSLLFKKPVVFTPLTGTMASRNDRMIHLCDTLGVARDVIPSDVAAAIRREINWESVARRLAEYRESSLQFLRRALEVG